MELFDKVLQEIRGYDSCRGSIGNTKCCENTKDTTKKCARVSRSNATEFTHLRFEQVFWRMPFVRVASIWFFTSHDDNDDALLAILTEWTSGGTYQDRISNIRSGGGSIAGNALIAGFTGLDDGDADYLKSFGGTDWYFDGIGDDLVSSGSETIDPSAQTVRPATNLDTAGHLTGFAVV